MIPSNTIDEIIRSVNIVDIIQRNGVSLKRAGKIHKGCCPFHGEKTPSFVVYENTQTYKCFGCGEGGNVINFVMKKNNFSFYEAVQDLAKEAHITIEFKNPTEEDLKLDLEKESMYAFYKKVAEYFFTNLYDKDHSHALNYARQRFPEKDDETIRRWMIGYASEGWDDLYRAMAKEGFTDEFLKKQDLFRMNKNDGYYDFFRDRLMFPIYDKVGRIIAFGGRNLSANSEAPKYLNSSETLIYHKSKVLFGLHAAVSAIRKYDVCVLVEGYADVVSLHAKGINNVVAACGTALTKEQIQEMGRYTKNFCLLYDSDAAGQKAIDKSAELIYSVDESYNVLVLSIPNDSDHKKQDPDTFFVSSAHFASYYDDNILSYPVYLATKQSISCSSNATEKAETILAISRMFHHKNMSEREVIMNQCAERIGPKNLWVKAMKEIDHEKKIKAEKEIKEGRTDEQNKSLELYQFYTHNNCYYFEGEKGKGIFKGSNFIMEPLFHIESTLNAKRLYKLTNEFKVVRVIEFPQKDMISISAFRLRCESVGNFRFDAGEYGLNKLKAYLYEQTKTCTEIIQLGWQKQGFWAWANGIYFNNQFQPINEDGICTYNNENFYLPALSSFYKADEMLFQFERKMKFLPGKITLNDWLKKFLKVYDNNGLVGFSFYCASLFRDVITGYFRFFPILNMFGPKGTGKSEMAISLSKLFGDLPVGMNMTNSTIASLADHVSRTRNALTHIDEYKNSVEYDKVEFLKGLWDGVGRSRMNMDKDKKKEMTAVDSAIMLTGQEMPTADVALFSRVLFLSFNKNKFTDEEKMRYNELKAIEKEGLSHITHEILSIRKDFVINFMDCYNSAAEDISKLIDKRTVEDRIFRNWLIVIASLKCVAKVIDLPFTYEKCLSILCNFIERQNTEIKSNGEVANFWDIFTYLVREGIAEDGYDFQIKDVTALKTDKFNFEGEKKIICVDLPKILQEYSKHGKNSSQKLLPIKSLQYYLENAPEYMGQKIHRLKVKTLKLNEKFAGVHPGDGTTRIQTRTVRTHVFDYHQLGLDIEVNYVDDRDINEMIG